MDSLVELVVAVVAALGGRELGGAIWRRIARKAKASGWRIGLWAAREDLPALHAEAAAGRAASERANAICRAAEARVARAERERDEARAVADARVAQCQTHTIEVAHERDELALQLARRKESSP